MKKFIRIAIILCVAAMLGGCTKNIDYGYSETNGKLTAVGQGKGIVLQGRYMVSDGESIYCAPLAKNKAFSNYEYYFAIDYSTTGNESKKTNSLMKFDANDPQQGEILYEGGL